MTNKISTETKFIYHNVGQGLFYSGEIKLSKPNKNIFRFVYDCGSENMQLIKRSVCMFKQDIESAEINLLIISHLHSDHVSGLDELFNNFKIKEVILPYFAPIERLLIAIRRINMPRWYYSFLSDPVKFLVDKGVERIIILGGEKSSKGVFPDKIFPASRKRDKLNIKKLPDDEELKSKIFKLDENWEKTFTENKLIIKNHNGYAIALGLWIFRFFNYKVPPSIFEKFKTCLDNKNFKIYNDNIKIYNDNIKKAIINKKILKNLKECYTNLGRYLRNDFNNTSLVLYHGPVCSPKSKSSFLCFCSCGFYNPCTGFEYINNNFGQFLTGDIDLNMSYDEIKKHYSRCFKNVLITQVPHHGAEKNWNERVIKDISNNKAWIISAGLKNRYGHPSYRVICNIYSNGKKSLWVNEINHVTIKGKVIWEQPPDTATIPYT